MLLFVCVFGWGQGIPAYAHTADATIPFSGARRQSLQCC